MIKTYKDFKNIRLFCQNLQQNNELNKAIVINSKHYTRKNLNVQIFQKLHAEEIRKKIQFSFEYA